QIGAKLGETGGHSIPHLGIAAEVLVQVLRLGQRLKIDRGFAGNVRESLAAHESPLAPLSPESTMVTERLQALPEQSINPPGSLPCLRERLSFGLLDSSCLAVKFLDLLVEGCNLLGERSKADVPAAGRVVIRPLPTAHRAEAPYPFRQGGSP